MAAPVLVAVVNVEAAEVKGRTEVSIAVQMSFADDGCSTQVKQPESKRARFQPTSA